jgi:hypothetical protein
MVFQEQLKNHIPPLNGYMSQYIYIYNPHYMVFPLIIGTHWMLSLSTIHRLEPLGIPAIPFHLDTAEATPTLAPPLAPREKIEIVYIKSVGETVVNKRCILLGGLLKIIRALVVRRLGKMKGVKHDSWWPIIDPPTLIEENIR